MSSSYVENPTDCRFEGQDENEKILLLLRAHPSTTLSWIIPSILLFLLPFFLPDLLVFVGFNWFVLPDAYRIVFLILNYLLILVITFEGFLYWYFNVYLITNKNIIDVDFHSILFKNIDIAPLRNIEDVSSITGGVFGSLFHFGHVFVQTAGATRSIDFHNVPTPHKVADFILDHTHRIHGPGGGPHAPH